MDFQKSLLSASYIKQHWLFLKLVEKYAMFSVQLTQVDRALKEPFVVTTFQFDKFKETLLIPNDYPSRIVSIKNLSSLHFFAMANIKILTHAVSLLSNSNEPLVKRCMDGVLHSFDVMDFRIKTQALKFLLEGTVHCNSRYGSSITQLLLQSFEAVNSRLNHWNVVVDDVNDFDKTLTQFLCDERILTNFCDTTDGSGKVFDFCLALIDQRREFRSANFERLQAACYQRMNIVLMKHISPTLIQKVNEFIIRKQTITKESLDLLEYCVLEECKTADKVYVWEFGCELTEDILCECDRSTSVDGVQGMTY